MITVILVEWPMVIDFGVALVFERERGGEEKVKAENNKIIFN